MKVTGKGRTTTVVIELSLEEADLLHNFIRTMRVGEWQMKMLDFDAALSQIIFHQNELSIDVEVQPLEAK